MSKLRSVATAFWSDPFIESLTPTEKLLFLYLITNEKTNMLGIYETSINKICFETGIDKNSINKSIELFESAGKIRYINNHIILLKFLKHQNFNTNMKISAIRLFNTLPENIRLSKAFFDESNPSESFQRLSTHYVSLSKVEYNRIEVEVEKEVEGEGESNLESDNAEKKVDITSDLLEAKTPPEKIETGVAPQTPVMGVETPEQKRSYVNAGYFGPTKSTNEQNGIDILSDVNGKQRDAIFSRFGDKNVKLYEFIVKKFNTHRDACGKHEDTITEYGTHMFNWIAKKKEEDIHALKREFTIESQPKKKLTSPLDRIDLSKYD